MASNDKYKNFTYQERIAEVARLYAENSRKNMSDVKWEADDVGQRKKVTERRSETSSRSDDKYAKNDAAKAERDDRRAKQSR